MIYLLTLFYTKSWTTTDYHRDAKSQTQCVWSGPFVGY